MKFKDYLQSLVSRRKTIGATTKPETKLSHGNHKPTQNTSFVDCHYDICSYEDVNNLLPDDQHSRTQALLARHAELVNNIVENRSIPSQEMQSSHSCLQCRMSSFQSTNVRPSFPLPPPLPPKLAFDQVASFGNRNYSSTLATCSPRRECQQMPSMKLVNSQYSTPNPSVISSSSSSLWTTNTTSRKQRSRIRTNPWIGTNSNQCRASTFIETSCHCHQEITTKTSQPEYCLYDPNFRTSPTGLIHSESFPQTISNGNIHLVTSVVSTSNAPPKKDVSGPTSSNTILHRSDSGHGYSLSSSRMINSSSTSSSSSSSASPASSSSSPENTNSDEILKTDHSIHRQKKTRTKNSLMSSSVLVDGNSKRSNRTVGCFRANTIGSESSPLAERATGYRVSPPISYQNNRSNSMNKNSLKKSVAADRFHHQHSTSSSSRSIDDHFSVEFEEILESERSCKQRKDRSSTNRIVSSSAHSSQKSPFILPLEETTMKLLSPSTAMPSGLSMFTSTLSKTNSRAILRHIEEIENEIRMIKNLDLDQNEEENEDFFISPRAYPEEDFDFDELDLSRPQDLQILTDEQENDANRPSIFEQVDQWVERCLQTTNKPKNVATRLHNECNQISKTIEDCVGYICNEETSKNSSNLDQTEMSIDEFKFNCSPQDSTKRTSSFNDHSSKKSKLTVIPSMKTLHECPF